MKIIFQFDCEVAVDYSFRKDSDGVPDRFIRFYKDEVLELDKSAIFEVHDETVLLEFLLKSGAKLTLIFPAHFIKKL